MDIDVKSLVEKVVEKVKGDDSLVKKFKEDPKSVVKSIIGDSIEDEIQEKIVDAVKAKIKLDDASGIVSKLKGILGK